MFGWYKKYLTAITDQIVLLAEITNDFKKIWITPSGNIINNPKVVIINNDQFYNSLGQKIYPWQ